MREDKKTDRLLLRKFGVELNCGQITVFIPIGLSKGDYSQVINSFEKFVKVLKKERKNPPLVNERGKIKKGNFISTDNLQHVTDNA